MSSAYTRHISFTRLRAERRCLRAEDYGYAAACVACRRATRLRLYVRHIITNTTPSASFMLLPPPAIDCRRCRALRRAMPQRAVPQRSAVASSRGPRRVARASYDAACMPFDERWSFICCSVVITPRRQRVIIAVPARDARVRAFSAEPRQFTLMISSRVFICCTDFDTPMPATPVFSLRHGAIGIVTSFSRFR